VVVLPAWACPARDVSEGQHMYEPGEYVPEPYDMVVFDRPPDGSRNRLFHVASHDADTGLTAFTELPDPLSAGQIAELGGRKVLWAKFVPESGDMVRFDRPPRW
jgi:hypothetical protein